MKATEPRLTRAVVEWTGWGSTPKPARDDARVIARFGHAVGPALATAARQLEADYSAGSTEFRSRHPELGVATLIALVVALFAGGRTGRGVTIGAIVVIAIWLVLVNHWLVIPGIN